MIITEDEIRQEVLGAIQQNRIMLFMKGTPEMPRCGFSMQTVACLNDAGASFAAMDILPDPRIREQLSAHSGWPTVPQLFVDGELVGGCDIVSEMYESGELHDTLGVERPQGAPGAAPGAADGAPLGIENRLG